ncbi:Oidioi.mRNA.OKI2018_I69.PAR.g9147.t1.cds [Oikopleura dioica]|uniref:Oidioi.mRNA.OKI2018_I69.PAR.g9147.t1.cds n=1 Tax=Oikopleura dioica TaxID=34765 RepID=A0ABN7RNL8_OIKDI|nr:Oidioi.mRNA.OKI2018_I69.PAR.g9147.t1.cds [Oikopleura dioica]
MKFTAALFAAATAAPAQLIIGGKNAVDGQFPWQVTLKRATGSHFCGGSILKNDVVMCAAHCKQSSNTFTAGAGSASLNGQRQVLNIRQQIPHPSYDSQRIDWDYMVIKTATNFSFDDYVKPIALVAPLTAELPNKTPCRTSGYGYSQYINGNPGIIASTLQWTDTECITNAVCRQTWLFQTLTSRQQCADYAGVTSCMGDSGGPLTYVQDGQEVLLGNVSWGHSKCSTNGYPAAYSRNADPTANQWIRTNAGL